jgi:glutaredoxin
MKNYNKIIGAISIIVCIVAVFFLFKIKKENNLIASVQGRIILFYKDDCPACANVEKFFQDNNVESKVLFEKKEVSNNKQNEALLRLLMQKKCNLKTNTPLPIIWDGLDSKCVSGEQDVINFFKEKLENDILSTVKDKMIFFYGEGCPHCANVEKFSQDNKVESKVQFEKQEVFNNTQNAYLMTLVATKKCNIPENELGVPFLWDGPDLKCLLGDQDIINFFKEKIGS